MYQHAEFLRELTCAESVSDPNLTWFGLAELRLSVWFGSPL